MPRNDKILVNLFAGWIVLIINILINFLLSPYIIKHIGVEANGYIQLANNFISFATIISTALNSMSSRFITIEIHKKNHNKANQYYSSVFAGNIFLLILMLIPVILIILNLNKLIHISSNYILSVQALFIWIFLNYFVNTGTPSWATAMFSTNRLYIQSIGNVISNIIRALLLVLLFSFFTPSISYVGIAAVASTLVLQMYLFYWKRKLMPELTFRKKYVNFSALKEIISSGIWNSINSASLLLNQGLDLLISNIFLGPIEMGILSLVKVIPSILGQFSSAISNVFMPNLTIRFAKGELDEMVSDIYQASKLNTIITTIPFVGFLCFGNIFFSLWVPSQNANQLEFLSILSSIGLIYSISVSPLWNIFSVVNELKLNTIVFFVTSIISFVITVFLVKTTDLGLAAICGVSSVINALKNIFFVVPYSAIYLGRPKWTFLPLLWYSTKSVIILLFTGVLTEKILEPKSWISLGISLMIFTIISLLINVLLFLNSDERMNILEKLKILKK